MSRTTDQTKAGRPRALSSLAAVKSMDDSPLCMNTTLRRPTERTCERCGRSEQWNTQTDSWQLAGETPGSVYCIHEWDINGRFQPFDRES